MNIDTLPTADLQAVTLGYLLHALEAEGRYAYSPTPGLPATTLHVEERGCVLSVTAAPAPLFADGVLPLATKLHFDVALLRVTHIDQDLVRLEAELALGLLPGAPWPMAGLEPWRGRDGALWLVPEVFGPAVSVDADGFHLELVPPYHTLAQRSAGVLRAAGELALLWRRAGEERR